MIAELLKRCDLSSNWDEVPEDLHLGRAALDDCSPCAGRLEPDKKYEILRIRQPLREMMQNAPARHHAARRNNDRWILACIDLLRLFGRLCEGESRPVERGTVLLDEISGLRRVFLGVLQKNFDGLDGHRAVAKNWNAGNLLRLHQLLKHEKKFLCALDRKCWNHDAPATLYRFANQTRQFRAGVGVGMLPDAISGLHHQYVGRFALLRSGVHNLPWRNLAVAHAADISGEEQSTRLAAGVERKLRHGRSQNVGRGHKSKR